MVQGKLEETLKNWQTPFAREETFSVWPVWKNWIGIKIKFNVNIVKAFIYLGQIIRVSLFSTFLFLRVKRKRRGILTRQCLGWQSFLVYSTRSKTSIRESAKLLLKLKANKNNKDTRNRQPVVGRI